VAEPGAPEVLPAAGTPLTEDERSELLRLRRAQAAHEASRARGRRFRWRSLSAALLVVLGCVLAPVAGLSVWLDNQVSDSDRFVRTMSPLVEDPDIQNGLTDRLTSTVFEYVDVQGIADEAVDALADQGLPPLVAQRLDTLTPTLTSAVTGFVRDRIGDLVRSDAFADTWNQAIRVAHGQMVTLLSGDSDSIVVRDGMVFLQLGPFVELAKERLSDADLTAVEAVPDVNPTVELVQADTLVRAQSAYSALDTVSDVAPWIVLLLLAVGIYLARNRWRALVGAGLGLVLAMLVLGVGLLIARSLLVGAVQPAAAPATGAGFDIVVHYLRLGMRAVAVLGLVLALAGFLAGRSESAVRIRRTVAGRLHSLRGGAAPTDPVSRFVRAHLRALRIVVVGIAVLVFLFVDQPTGRAIVAIAALVLVALAVLEFLGRPGEEPPAESRDDVDPVSLPPPPVPGAAPGPVAPPAPRGGGERDAVPR
jgi:hypothetical protein